MVKKRHNYQNRLKTFMAFTLVELLLVTVVIAVLSASLYRALSVGLKVWEHSRVFSAEEDIAIFLDKISMDLRNAVEFSLLDFSGRPDQIEIPTIVSVPLGRVGGAGNVEFYADQIGVAAYGFDAARQAIYRQKANYGQAIDGDFGGKSFLASRVKGLRFRYFDRNLSGLASRKLSRETLPAAVEVSVEYIDIHGKLQILKRLINLPINL